jgi:hypothetical protein
MNVKNTLEKGLKNMKISRLADEQDIAPTSDEHYPYGLKITLNEKEIDNLGLRVSKLRVDDEVELECRAKIISVRKDDCGHGNSESVELQITHLALEEKD